MSITSYLLDSDAAKCMCQYGLMQDLATALSVTLSDFYILSQLRYQLRLGTPTKALEKLGTAEAVQQAQLLVSSAAEVVVLTESANYLLLQGTPDIDGGELALFAALCDQPNSGLITGDKRSLVALCKVEGLGATLSWAHIMCTEETIRRLIKHFGWQYISDRIRAQPDVNIGLSLIFGRSSPASEQAIHEGLDSHINALAIDTGGKYITASFTGQTA
ncbi:hypothetical protein [Dyella koreensis]|uniref:PIN domain-containing protein n=1 Tax=Dyella koreensis TaxID=311235 RepID=A0ABW8K836_9GAMM